MERYVHMEDISDGKLYKLNDMVKADCLGCEGCSACCRGMGNSILLDPYDIYRLEAGLGMAFEELLAEFVELNVVEGIILPNLKMTGEAEKCAFLNEAGRCRIHEYRPGLCRLFPLGRFYDDHTFQYFLQTKECHMEKRGKVKVKAWIDTPNIKTYEKYICDWHFFIKELTEKVQTADDIEIRRVNMGILNQFFIKSYNGEQDFYIQFYQRLDEVKRNEE